MKMRDQRGFSLVEMIIVIAIIAIVATVSLINLRGFRSRTDLNSSVQKISALLREAQSRSGAQESGKIWGVHFENSISVAPFYALFYDTYGSTTVIERYALPNMIGYSASSISRGSSTTITFSQISGFPSASTSITLVFSVGGTAVTSSVIRISSSGLIWY